MKVFIGRYPKGEKERTVRVRIDSYDCWGLDHTLALIIHPALIRMKADKQGAPITDDDDVPDNLKSTAAPPKLNEWDTDDLFFARWDWIMDEMIWAFAQIIDEEVGLDDKWGPSDEELKVFRAWDDRIHNGLMLFGKYYRALWD